MDFASLGIKINTDAVRTAASDLDKLATSGAKAEVAASKLAEAGKAASGGFANTSDAIKKARSSTDDFIRSQNLVIATQGQSASQSKLTELALKGATAAQLQSVAANHKLIDGYQRGVSIGEDFNKMVKRGAIALGAAAVAAAYFFQKTVDGIADYKDLGEKIGDSAENIASLQKASDVSGKSLDDVANFSIKLTKALSKTDDEAKIAGRALEAIGLTLKEFKAKGPVDQIESLAKALDGFKDGPEKTAVLEALAKGSANLIPFFNDLADGAERNVRLTEEQITQADEYSKRQARLKSDLSAFAQVVVAESLPAVVAFTGGLTDAISGAFGLSKESTDLGNNKGVANFAKEASIGLAELVDVIANASNLVLALGGSFQVVAADIKTMFNVATTAFSAFLPGDAFKEQNADLKKAATERDAILKSVNERYGRLSSGLGLADKVRLRFDAQAAAANTVPAGKKPTIDTSNLVTPTKTKKNTAAEQAAKTQLAFDIDMEKKAGEARVDAFANSERILEAQRSAGLVQEGEYYAQKRKFLTDTTAAQEDAIRLEIARYQAEKATVSNKSESIRIDQKIFDSEAQLAKLRAKGATDLTILAIQEKAAATSRVNAYKDAQAAAEIYFSTIERGNARELAGIGQGARRREQDARRSQRDDQLQSRRDSLDQDLRRKQITKQQYDDEVTLAESTHQRVLASDDKFFAARLEKQGNWANGANEALQNYADESRNIMEGVNGIFTNAFKGLEDQVTNLFTGKKVDIKGLFDSINSDIIRQIVKTRITGPLAESIAGEIKSGDGAGGALGSFFTSLFGGGGGAAPGNSATSAAGSAANAASLATLSAATVAASTVLAGLTASATAAATALAAVAVSSGGGGLASGISSGFGTGSAFGNLDFGGFFANGGSIGAGQFGVTGERGRELVAGPATVIPFDKLKGAANDGGTQNTTINVTVPQGTSRDTASQIASRVSREISRPRARGQA